MSKINNPDYTHYVVSHGKIESGWENKDDAKDQIKDNLHPKMASGAKVVAKSALKSRHDLNPEIDDHWHNAASTKNVCEAVAPARNSFIRNLFENNLYALVQDAKVDLAERAQFILESSDKKLILASARGQLLEFVNDSKDNTHYVIGKGKIISGHTNKEAADFHQSRIAHKVGGEAKVVERGSLKKAFFDPSNEDHWAKRGELYEEQSGGTNEIVESEDGKHHLIDRHTGNVVGKYKTARTARNARDKKDNEYGGYRYVVKSPKLEEMQDQPDNQINPLSREAVKRLFKDYKRLPATGTNIDDIEAHTEDGIARAGDHNPAKAPDSAHAHHDPETLADIRNQYMAESYSGTPMMKSHFVVTGGKVLSGHPSEDRANDMKKHLAEIGYDHHATIVQRGHSSVNPDDDSHWHPYGEVTGARNDINRATDQKYPRKTGDM